MNSSFEKKEETRTALIASFKSEAEKDEFELKELEKKMKADMEALKLLKDIFL